MGILMWVVTSVALGLMMILVLRRRESRAPHLEPQLSSPVVTAIRPRRHAGAACQQKARHRRLPPLGR